MPNQNKIPRKFSYCVHESFSSCRLHGVRFFRFDFRSISGEHFIIFIRLFFVTIFGITWNPKKVCRSLCACFRALRHQNSCKWPFQCNDIKYGTCIYSIRTRNATYSGGNKPKILSTAILIWFRNYKWNNRSQQISGMELSISTFDFRIIFLLCLLNLEYI